MIQFMKIGDYRFQLARLLAYQVVDYTVELYFVGEPDPTEIEFDSDEEANEAIAAIDAVLFKVAV